MDIEILKLRLYQGLSEDLRKWFKDGGWNRYNTKGEKVGKCARDDKDGDGKADGPKPKCLPASKAASLGKKKVAAAVKRKRSEDPNPNRKGAAKNVNTESVEVNEVVGTTIAGTVGAATAKKKDRVRKAVGTGAGYAVGSTVGRAVGAGAAGGVPIVGGLLKGAGGAAGSVAGGVGGAVVGNKLAGETKKKKKTNEEIEVRVGDFMEACWKGYEKKGMKTMFGKRYPNCVKKTTKEEVEQIDELINPKINLPFSGDKIVNSGGGVLSGAAAAGLGAATAYGLSQLNKTKKKKKKKTTKEETELQEFRFDPEGARKAREALPKKDYSWRNKQGEKPGIDLGLSKDVDVVKNPGGTATQIAKDKVVKPAVDYVKKQATDTLSKGADAVKGAAKSVADYATKNPGKAAAIGAGVVGAGALAAKALGGGKKKNQNEHVTFQSFNEKAMKCWDTHKKVGMKMKGGKLVNDCRPKNEEVQVEGAAWTKKSGKNSEGGLNEKGRKSYERENPGSDLKAPSKKVGNKRRASFCARMKGMRKRQKPSNNTGEDRLSKSLRAWNC